jgi:predicted glutamine amidotransferase
MCRLFGMSAGRRPMRATFWLLEAPDSLAEQSRRNPEGYGIATFEDDGTPHVDKRPAAAYQDELFAREAREEESRTFVAHVRFASTGDVRMANTHPFEQRGRVFAHNGHVGDLEKIDARLDPRYRELVLGDTDSERVFALITQEIDAREGDIEAGIVDAVRWIAAELPLFALNFVLATDTHLWTLRYPDAHEVHLLERGAGGPSGQRHFDAASAAGTVRVRAGAMRSRPAVVVASEQMDEDPGWRQLQSDELVRVDPDLTVHSRTVVGGAPAHQLRLEDLGPRALAAMHIQHGLKA